MSTARKITIAGVVFTCSRVSEQKLRRALWTGKLLRVYPGYDADTAEVCRDLLIEHITGRKRYVPDKRVDEVIALIIPAKLIDPLQLLRAVKTNTVLLVRKAAVWVVRYKEVLLKMALALLAVFESASLLSWGQTYTQAGVPYRYQADFYGTVEAPAARSAAVIALIQLALGVCMLLLCLGAIRYKKLRWAVLGALIVVTVLSPMLGGLISSPSSGSYALACGDRILTNIDFPKQRTEFSVTSAHWKLVAPLPSSGSLENQQDCDTYLAARKSYPDAQLVVASYVRTDSGNLRPLDPIMDTGAELRYGFFVLD